MLLALALSAFTGCGGEDGEDTTTASAATPTTAAVQKIDLKQIDSATGEIVAEYGPDEGSGDALVSDGALWVSAFDARTVYRLPIADAG